VISFDNMSNMDAVADVDVLNKTNFSGSVAVTYAEIIETAELSKCSSVVLPSRICKSLNFCQCRLINLRT